MKINPFTRNLAVGFAILFGLYPLAYSFSPLRTYGYLHIKPEELRHSVLWITAFYTHISTGGFALLFGWLQFNSERRARHIGFHRILGRCYVSAVAISGISGLYIALFATGGLVSAMGFGTLALCWLFTDIMAYRTAVKRHIDAHRRWMILNYSLTFAAVTLRMWLFLLMAISPGNFIPGFRVISWLCWIPNLVIAILISRQLQNGLSNPPKT